MEGKMKLKQVKVKKRFKFENLGLLGLIGSILLGLVSMYLFTIGLGNISNELAKICLGAFVISWFMVLYGQHARNHKKIIIEIEKIEDYHSAYHARSV